MIRISIPHVHTTNFPSGYACRTHCAIILIYFSSHILIDQTAVWLTQWAYVFNMFRCAWLGADLCALLEMMMRWVVDLCIGTRSDNPCWCMHFWMYLKQRRSIFWMENLTQSQYVMATINLLYKRLDIIYLNLPICLSSSTCWLVEWDKLLAGTIFKNVAQGAETELS